MCRWIWALTFGLLLLEGCNSDPGPRMDVLETAPVSGKLTYKGQPLESFQVVFTPTDGRRPAMGRTDAAGKFTLGTNEPGDGAPIGSHRVSVAFDPVSEVDSTVAAPIDNPAQLPKPKIEIPKKYSNPETSGLTQEVPEDGLEDLKIDLQ